MEIYTVKLKIGDVVREEEVFARSHDEAYDQMIEKFHVDERRVRYALIAKKEPAPYVGVGNVRRNR